MFQLLERLHYHRSNNKLKTIIEESESNDLEESEFFQYQSFEDVNDNSQINKLKQLLKKIRYICFQIKIIIIKIWKSFIFKKSE